MLKYVVNVSQRTQKVTARAVFIWCESYVERKKETFAAFDDVVKKLVVDVCSALAKSPIFAVEHDRRQAALKPGRTTSPAAAASVALPRRQSADVEVVVRQVEVHRPRVGKLVDVRPAVDDQPLTAHGRSKDGHRVPGVVVQRRRQTVGQHANPAADVEHVADSTGQQLDRQEVAVVVAAAVEHQRVLLRRLHLNTVVIHRKFFAAVLGKFAVHCGKKIKFAENSRTPS